MRGEVEIWEGDKLIHKESNLLVNGAGEAIVDMLTVSPSLSGIPSASALLDTSNYTIQAISFGKDASAYQFNAHALPYRRNFFYDSTPSSSDSQAISFTNELIVSSRPDITPPPEYATVPSSIAHVLSLEDKNDDTNSVLQQKIYVTYDTTDFTISGGQDNWFCASVYIKHPVDQDNLVPIRDTATTNRHPNVSLGMSIYGDGYDPDGTENSRGNLGFSRLNTVSYFNDLGAVPTAPLGEISAISLGYSNAREHGNARAEVSGYSIDNWQQNGGAIPVGDGWYRVWTAGLAPVSALSGINVGLYAIGWESDGETQGGTYGYGWQLESGRWPTDLDFAHSRVINNWDLSGSVLNRDHVPGFPTDNGTVRVIPPYGTSSYVPTNYLSSPPNPDSTRVEDGDTALLDTSSDILDNFNMGQNLNVIPYRKNPGGPNGLANVAGSQRLVPHNVFKGNTLPGLFNNYANNYYEKQVSGFDSFGPQAYYLGCYPEGSSTGGSTFALVSSLDNSAAYLGLADASSSPYYVHGTYNSIVNEASSMDVSGFVNMVMSGSPGTTTGYAMSSTASGLCVSGGADSTNSGIVEYSMLLGSGDVGYSNLYGGIYNMGLWTIDTEASRLAGNSPPYSFGPLDNPRKYKLFATKHLTKNLGFIEDSGINPGCLNYSDLTIKWRIHFT
jgi:hypothetical protein